MKILSLFDGMSVAQQALKEIGADVEVYYSSEIDDYAKAVTQSNFPNTIQVGSVTELKGSDFTNIDLIVGGSPCTDLSIAKKGRQGLKGEQSKLFYDYVRLVKEIRPKFFILENVNSMAKDQKAIMEKELFGIEATMINASLVSAQNRKRIFIVGKRIGDTYVKVEIPQPEDRGILLKDILESDVDEKYYVKNERKNTMVSNRPQDAEKEKANTLLVGGTNPTIKMRDKSLCLDANYYKGTSVEHYKEKSTRQLVPQRIGSLNSGGQGDRIYSKEGKSVSLSANGGGRGAKTGLYEVSGAASRTYPRTKTEGQTRSKQIEVRQDGKANAMTSVQGDSMVAQETQIRKLTPTECLRLQSMPDNYFEKAIVNNKPISNTQRYKMCGNAFNKEVIVHILRHLFC